MEFTALKESFVIAAQNVLRAIPGKTERAELSGILIAADGGIVTLSGTDTELGIKCQFPAQINTSGETLLPGRYLVDILRRLPPGPLLFKMEPSNDHIYINSGASHFELLALPSDRFPRLQFDDQAAVAQVPELALRTGINQVAFAAARDGLRQLLNSVLISFENKKMRLVATDGHRLALAETVELDQDIPGEYLVPVRTLEEVARLIAGEEEVQIAGSERQIAFRTKNTLVQSSLVEGKYLPYTSVIPTEFSWQAVIKRTDLLAALERAELFSADKINAVNLKLTAEGIEVFAQSADIGRVQELVPAEIEGGELDISFNVRYLLEPLKILAADKIQLDFTGPESAVLISPTGSTNYRYLVMPVTTRATA